MASDEELEEKMKESWYDCPLSAETEAENAFYIGYQAGYIQAEKDFQGCFYEVNRNTPIGNVTMGRFRSEEKAKATLEEWNSSANDLMDKAWISIVSFDD